MEILAVEFVRKLDEFSLRHKSLILYSLAKGDIDARNILSTTHTVLASTLEVFKLQ